MDTDIFFLLICVYRTSSVVSFSFLHKMDANVYDDGYLRIEHDNYYVACGGVQLSLSRKEFLIISRLARNAERIIPSEEIWRYAWGDGAPFNAKSLRVHIHRLRHILTPVGLRIESMVGVGYRLSLTAQRNGNEHAG